MIPTEKTRQTLRALGVPPYGYTRCHKTRFDGVRCSMPAEHHTDWHYNDEHQMGWSDTFTIRNVSKSPALRYDVTHVSQNTETGELIIEGYTIPVEDGE